MKIACEKCEKVMDDFFGDEYKKILIDGENIVLCKECSEKLYAWMYKGKEEAETYAQDKLIAIRKLCVCEEYCESQKEECFDCMFCKLEEIEELAKEGVEDEGSV